MGKWSNKTISAAGVHYNQQYDTLELEEKAQIPQEMWSLHFWKKWPHGIKVENKKKHTGISGG